MCLIQTVAGGIVMFCIVTLCQTFDSDEISAITFGEIVGN